MGFEEGNLEVNVENENQKMRRDVELTTAQKVAKIRRRIRDKQHEELRKYLLLSIWMENDLKLENEELKRQVALQDELESRDSEFRRRGFEKCGMEYLGRQG